MGELATVSSLIDSEHAQDEDEQSRILSGNLLDAPIARVLGTIIKSRLSGTLIVESNNVDRVIHFDQGETVLVASSREEDRLGSRLLAAGKISPDDLEMAAMFLGKKRIGEAIVSVGALSSTEIQRELHRQALAIATSLYSLGKGNYHFEKHDCQIPETGRIELSPYWVQFQGVRRMASERLLKVAIDDIPDELHVVKSPPLELDPNSLRGEEKAVLAAVAGSCNVTDMLSTIQNRSERAKWMRALYSLWMAGFLAGVEGSADGALILPDQELASPLTEKPAPTSVEQDAFALDPTRSEHPDASTPDEEQTYLSDDELAIVQREAKNLAARFEAIAKEKQPVEPAPETPTVTGSEPSELPADFTPPVDPAIFNVPEPAHSAGDQESAEPIVSAAEPTKPPQESGAKSLENDEHARALKSRIRDADIALMCNDWAQVIKLLKPVIQALPDNAECLVKYAKALGKTEQGKDAEPLFRRAISMEPQNAGFQIELSRYYLQFKMASRAIHQLEAVLAIAPQNKAARKLLAQAKKRHADANSPAAKIKNLFK